MKKTPTEREKSDARIDSSGREEKQLQKLKCTFKNRFIGISVVNLKIVSYLCSRK